MRIVVSGFLGLFPAGGVAWDYIQYPLGFKALGHDVYYVEDTGLWPVFQVNQEDAGQANARYLDALMSSFGLQGKWAYRDEASGRWFGLDRARVARLLESADVFVNVSCANVLRDEYMSVPVRILVDSDPMFTQVQIIKGAGMTKGSGGLANDIPSYTHLFTFGENMGAEDCRVPDGGLAWIPTRQPVALDLWENDRQPSSMSATTVMNWSVTGDIEFSGQSWGQKRRQWPIISGLPKALLSTDFRVAVGQTSGAPFPEAEARATGWSVLDASEAVPDWSSYREFVLASAVELSVAKHAYVAARTGWFSCRSACYLAASRPVVVEETGWSRTIPEGSGAIAFETEEQAVEALQRVVRDWQTHSSAARTLAMEHFDGRKVLSDMLRAAT